MSLSFTLQQGKKTEPAKYGQAPSNMGHYTMSSEKSFKIASNILGNPVF